MAVALDQVVNEFNHDVVLVGENQGDLFGDPSWGGELSARLGRATEDGSRKRGTGTGPVLLHDLDVDFLHVHLLIELGRELGALEELGIDAGGHGCGRVGGVCDRARR